MSEIAPPRADVCAVVVTYFPKSASADSLVALASQVGKILVVDNGSSAESLRPVAAVAPRLDVSILRLGGNFGIARALNEGLRFAREHGFRWLATFDQDSQCTPGMIQEMLSTLDAYPQSDRVAVVSPRHVDRVLGHPVGERRTEASGEGWRIVPSAMTSGNVVDVEKATCVGGFDDSLFIDCVDHEFCLRLRRHGFKILEASRAELLHSLGRLEQRRFLFRRVNITNHAEVRRYYMSRNRLILWRRYWRGESWWVLNDMRRFLTEALCVVLYEKRARAKVPMILRGLRDGLRGVRGPLKLGG